MVGRDMGNRDARIRSTASETRPMPGRFLAKFRLPRP